MFGAINIKNEYLLIQVLKRILIWGLEEGSALIYHIQIIFKKCGSSWFICCTGIVVVVSHFTLKYLSYVVIIVGMSTAISWW